MKIKFFIIKYNSQEINFPSEKKMIGKKLWRWMELLFLMFCMVRKEKYIALMFQNITKMVKRIILLMIPNGVEWQGFAK